MCRNIKLPVNLKRDKAGLMAVLIEEQEKTTEASHRLHVQDGGLGDDHRPVPSVTFQLCFGSLGRRFPRWVKRGFGEGCESILSHKLTKILKETDLFDIF